MTDLGPDPTAAAPEAPALPELDGYVRAEVHQREIADRQRERNLLKPYSQTIGRLPEGQRSAILALAQMAAEGDNDGIVDWATNTIEGVSGRSAAEVIAARQAATPVGAPLTQGAAEPAVAPAFDISDVIRQAVDAARQETRQETQRARDVAAITSELTAAGFDPMTPTAQAIVYAAKGKTGASPLDAIRQSIAEFKADLLGQQQRAQAAAVAAAGQVAPLVPGGVPVGSAPVQGQTPAERAMARLRAVAG